jgi:hypothetical protein
MRESTSGDRRACAALALAIAAFAQGCYGMPRLGGHAGAGAGGSGGVGGSTGGSPVGTGDAASDASPTGCPANCPGPTSGPTTGSGACINDECRISCNSTFPTLCPASNACADLTSDSKNCGACGHDCLGGMCVAAQCQPVLIAQYTGNPQTIYVGDQAVYITTDLGYVGRARKDGSDLKPLAMPGFASSAYYGTVLAEDSDRVFLARYGGGSAFQLSYCLTSGCDSTATTIGGPYTQYFALDQPDHRVLWVDYSPARLMRAGTVGTVLGVDLPGGALPPGANGTRLFYASGGLYFVDGTNVNRIPVSGGSIATVASGTASLAILGANSTALFVYDGSSIGSVALPSGEGGSPRPVIATVLNVGVDGHFAADDDAMYWVSNGQVNTCHVSNCSGTQEALPKRAADVTWDVGLDGAAVYLLADSGISDNGTKVCTVWKLAR